MVHTRILSWFLILGAISCYQASTINMAQPTNAIDELTPAANLSAITWAHAVNSQKELDEALNSTVQMIEADIVLGKINNTGEDLPVMGHPPATTSDISLKTFLNTILDHNTKNTNDTKGVKLDFKSTEVFEGSLDILKELWSSMNYPIWLNADILSGPVNNTATKPVDPARFFAGSNQFPNAVLSIGWTTRWGSNFTGGIYTDNEINAMIQAIKDNKVNETKQAITYPVRAGIAANSQAQLHNLVEAVNSTNDCTLTIWSSQNDYVNIEKLQTLILSFGVDRVYLDVPEEVSSKLRLGSGSRLSTVASFGLISLFMWVASVALQRTQI